MKKELPCGVDLVSTAQIAYKGRITIYHQLPSNNHQRCDGCHLQFTQDSVILINNDPNRKCVQNPAYTEET